MEASIVQLDEKLMNKLESLSDEELKRIQFSFPWQYGGDTASEVDPDFSKKRKILKGPAYKEDTNLARQLLQQQCWDKCMENPQINTSIRGTVGRLNGMGFGITSDSPKIQKVIDEIELDPRNRLYLYYPKYTARALIEGELFLCFTCHDDGFIEIDFIDPSIVSGRNMDGIIYHPRKAYLPLIYTVNWRAQVIDQSKYVGDEQIPSIFIARYPNLLDDAKDCIGFDAGLLKKSMKKGRKYSRIGGFFRFIVAWDRTFITRRNVSHLRTTIKWLEYYENLKEYEIDHKKSAGAYLWVVTISDPKSFRLWLGLSATERRATGIAAKKTPGSTMVLPPGMELKCVNPQLPKITGMDTDIMDMAISGLNEPADITMGTSKSPYASVKASRGPMSDRTSDEICWYERFLRHDFWGSIFFLKNILQGFPTTFKVREAVDFKKKKQKDELTGKMEDTVEPIFENVLRRPEELIEISFPVSEIIDAEARSRAYLGVKHGSTVDTLGIPNSEIAKRLGFGNYRQLRLTHATEQERYPELVATINAEAMQEQAIAEPPVAGKGAKPKAQPAAKPKAQPKPKLSEEDSPDE